MDEHFKSVYDVSTGETTLVPLTPDEIAQMEADAAAGQNSTAAAAFERAEDAERLRIIVERAKEDPAYRALSDIVLSGKGL